jgi:hypothetical protein
MVEWRNAEVGFVDERAACVSVEYFTSDRRAIVIFSLIFVKCLVSAHSWDVELNDLMK